MVEIFLTVYLCLDIYTKIQQSFAVVGIITYNPFLIQEFTSTLMNISAVHHYLLSLQQGVTDMLLYEDPSLELTQDQWQHTQGGGGQSWVLHQGEFIEQAGVNFSHVKGEQLPKAATLARPELEGLAFEALGVSLVIHPRNPYVPTTHANVRLFVTYKEEGAVWWFGGGFDLTPYYAFKDDCVLWHTHAKKACDTLSANTYAHYKTWCDDYFYLKHRQEARGIGGIFFDDLNTQDFASCFEFIKQVGHHFCVAYQSILSKRKGHAYGERERNFQLYRRGRYVEFNLIYDRGTLFGLQSNGRTESILMSLPPTVTWRYNWQPEAGTPEADLYDYYLKARDWLSDAANC